MADSLFKLVVADSLFKLIEVIFFLNLHSVAFRRWVVVLQFSLIQGVFNLIEDEFFIFFFFSVKCSFGLCCLGLWWGFFFFLVEEFWILPSLICLLLVRESILMKALWTFEYDRKIVTAANIVIKHPIIVHVAKRIRLGKVYSWGICCLPYLTGNCGTRPFFFGRSWRRAGTHKWPKIPTASTAFPLLGAPQASGNKPNPLPRKGKKPEGCPLRPEEISSCRDTLGQIRVAEVRPNNRRSVVLIQLSQ